MANSKITINFVIVPAAGTFLNITETSLNIPLFENFVANRLGSNQVTVPKLNDIDYKMTISNTANISNKDVEFTPIGGITTRVSLSNVLKEANLDGTVTYFITSSTDVRILDAVTQTYILWAEGSFSKSIKYSEFISTNYKNAFNLDHNASGLFTVTSENGPVNSGIGTVVIIANYPNANFVINGSSAGATITTDNQIAVADFNISNVAFVTATTGQSQKVKVNVTTSQLANKIISPFVLNLNANNPFSFDWLRGQTINLIVENAAGTQSTKSVVLPALLNALNFSSQINNSPNGATVVIENTSSNGLVLQYSLNNITFQSSNVFNGLETGLFTFYVKDQFGDAISKAFKVSEFGIYTPYFYISKSNSIRFANRIAFNDSANYKNDENTLSCETDSKIPYKEIQQFQSADVITTQFKSNYRTNTAKIIKVDASEVNVPVVKMSNNIGIKDKLDAIKYNLGDGKTGIYFLSGNRYDYATNAVSKPYLLNGALPEWAQIGNYIQLGVAWFLIEEIIYDDTKNADVLVISNIYTGIDTAIIVGTIYNRENYEIYEFTIDMVQYINQYFKVRINNTDSNFTEIIHLSEQIWCKIKHEKVLEISYRNSTNTDIFYATGITNLIRVPYTFIKGKVDEDSETHKTDTTAILLNADMYEVDDFVFEPVTKELWRKLLQALSHEIVTINGVGYVKNGNFNTEGPLEESNLYVLTATMMKTGSVYNSQSSGSLDFNTSSVEVPGLITTESGYVSY